MKFQILSGERVGVAVFVAAEVVFVALLDDCVARADVLPAAVELAEAADADAEAADADAEAAEIAAAVAEASLTCLFFAARLPPTAPPTAATMMITTRMASRIKKSRRFSPKILFSVASEFGALLLSSTCRGSSCTAWTAGCGLPTYSGRFAEVSI